MNLTLACSRRRARPSSRRGMSVKEGGEGYGDEEGDHVGVGVEEGESGAEDTAGALIL